jgi:3-oxoacyl-[acyl-carrier-protein] synthase II
MRSDRRVVITGLGVVSPIGIGINNFWTSLTEGKSGIKRITRFDASTYSTRVAGEIPDFDPFLFLPYKDARRMDRSTQMLVAAAHMALTDSDWKITGGDRDKYGVFTGTAIGGQEWAFREYEIFREKGLKRISPYTAISTFPNATSAQLSHRFNLMGPSVTLSSGCASSTMALGYALDNLRLGRIDMALVGGTEAPLNPGIFGAYCAARVMTSEGDNPTRVPRPFDSRRDGIVLSEGAAALVLEVWEQAAARGARMYAEVSGWAQNTDSYSMMMMGPDGSRAKSVMLQALRDAEATVEEIDYVQAHAPGTVADDRTEINALQSLFGERADQVWVSSVKSMLGHTQGACGAIESAAAALSIYRGAIPPTINCVNLEPSCILRVNRERSRPTAPKAMLLNTFGFGGKNVSIILRGVD